MRKINLLELLCTYLVFMCVGIICAELDDSITDRSQDELHPLKEFSHYTVVKPIMYYGRQKRQIATSRNQNNTNHVEKLTVVLPIDNEELELNLTLNKQLIPKGYFLKIQVKGIPKLTQPTPEEAHLCHYNGNIKDKPNSWVALSTCNGLLGVIYNGDEMHYIEKSGSEVDDEHILYKQSHLIEQNKTCGHGVNENIYSNNNTHQFTERRTVPAVRGPYNANKESKFIELVLVVDNRKFKELNESVSKTEEYCKSIANIVNGFYAPLNIFIALVGVVIWTEQDEIKLSSDGDNTLSQFLMYRKKHLLINHPNDNAQLITKFNFENAVVAKALKGPICSYQYSGGVNVDNSKVISVIARTIAHSLGHNFGMEHDTENCTCQDDHCIMSSSYLTQVPSHWSSCSLESLLHAFVHGRDYCLRNKPTALLNSPVCGNGFTEFGEECDCGLSDNCNNSCCDGTTCKLRENATCGTGECCDLKTCKLKTPGTVCRLANSECDLPEYCTGDNEYCPENFYKIDSEICQNGKAFCYQGLCRTRDDQCRLLWGGTGRSSEHQCYRINFKGTRHGNCGYNKLNQTYVKCSDENNFCGMLHCEHLTQHLEFGMESISVLSRTFIEVNGSIILCSTAIIDLGFDQVDPGLVPNGAKCDEGKMCLNQNCVSVESVQENHSCPHNCYNNGWCNNLGHCHCKDGYVLPFCEHFVWPGGSVDSGRPASLNLNAN